MDIAIEKRAAGIIDLLLRLPADERSTAALRACAGDAHLLKSVQSLLAEVLLIEGLTGESKLVATVQPHVTGGEAVGQVGERAGDQIGRYKLLQQIGEGGFGVVYMAEQEVPVKRRVAVKVIKAGMDTRSVIARFEAERQALAMMDHPHIAHVLDAGATEAGRPYFVMELVKGIPITDYCDQASLNTQQRLELFLDVCRAVQHAHQKGIIHRDLKPSNILVTLHDTKATVKVIDFGIAKATDQKLTEKTLFTNYGQMIGTPAYMSPEQAIMSGLDVDTRSDVYSLGVLLYELLAGSPPFDTRTLRSAGFEEMRRIIREELPSKPSTRLSTLAPDRKLAVAASRQTNPQTLDRQLRGDLDWVILKAIEKDRNRRYESASAFAVDIQRHLNCESVTAGAPGRVYRLRRFAWRNRVSVSVGMTIVLLLLAGTVVSTWQAIRATRAERHDDEERRIAEAVKDFLQNKLLAQADVSVQADSLLRDGDSCAQASFQTTIRELLDRAAQEVSADKIEKVFPHEPLVQAEILQTIGLALEGTGEYLSAIDCLKRAMSIRSNSLGPDDPATLKTMNDLGAAYRGAGNQGQALSTFKEALRLMKAKTGSGDRQTLNVQNNLALAYKDSGKFDLAIPLYQETLRLMSDNLGSEDSDTLNTANNLADAYLESDTPAPAVPILEQTLESRQRTVGPEHPQTLTTIQSLAVAYHKVGRFDEAVQLLKNTLEEFTEKLGPSDPATLDCMSNLAQFYKEDGKIESALPLFRDALAGMKKQLGPDHPTTLNTMNSLAVALFNDGKSDEAIQLFEQTLELDKARLGAEHPRTRGLAASLLEAYGETKRFAKFEQLGEEYLKVLKKTSGKGSLEYGSYATFLGRDLLLEEKWRDAEPYLRDASKIREKAQPDAWSTFNTESLLGGSLLGQKKYADAEPLLVEGYNGMEQREKIIPAQGQYCLTEAIDRLIEFYSVMNKPGEVQKWREKRATHTTTAASQ